MSTATSIRKRVEKLLRLAESSNPHEAELATQKAEALMIQWGIEVAELDAESDQREKIIEKHRYYTTNSRGWVLFVSAICRGFGGIQVLRMNITKSKVRLYVIGHESDVERLEMLLDSLEIQADRALASWWSSYDRKNSMPKSQWYKAKHQFLGSFGQTVGLRLEERRQEQVAERGTGTELVLVNRDEAVQDWMHQNHNVRTSRGRYQGSYHGASAGAEAGRNASLGEKGLGGRRSLG